MPLKPSEIAEGILRAKHFECEDCWYSCHVSEDCCYEDKTDKCTCGLERRQRLARTYLRLREAAQDVAKVTSGAVVKRLRDVLEESDEK